MDDKEIFELIKSSEKTHFNEMPIPQVRQFLERLLGEEFILPTPIGDLDFPEEYRIHNLKPASKITVLTIQNYLEFLKEMEERTKTYPEEIHASLLFNNDIERRHSIFQDIPILQAEVGLGMQEENQKRLFQRFGLTFYFYKANGFKESLYEAVSKLTPTRLEKIARRFQGPNREYKRTLA